MGIVLTDRQVVAAASYERLVNIVSAPGSGKTTVAAERAGYVRYARCDLQRGVLALSFTRSAVAELRKRIVHRWGSNAVTLPNLVTTFDDLHVRALHHLLRLGVLRWPGGLVDLDVLETYQGLKGHRWLPAGSYQRIAQPDTSGRIVSAFTRPGKPRYGIGSVADHRAVLEAGRVTHEDVRHVLLGALDLGGVKDVLKSWLASSFSAIVIDEVYDADRLDLAVAHLAAEQGLGVTVVGDPWQALYEWRGATPARVAVLLEAFPFAEFEQPESFRFRGTQMRSLASALRDSRGVQVPVTSSTEIDIAIGRQWAGLWGVGENILPLAFRTLRNATDAMLNLLLDEVTRAALGRPSFGRQGAYTFLRLDVEAAEHSKRAILEPVLSALANGVDTEEVLDMLRGSALTLGAPRRPSRLRDGNETDVVMDLERLRARLGRDDLVPGLTVHQAKGCEWDRVGVVLTPEDELTLAGGPSTTRSGALRALRRADPRALRRRLAEACRSVGHLGILSARARARECSLSDWLHRRHRSQKYSWYFDERFPAGWVNLVDMAESEVTPMVGPVMLQTVRVAHGLTQSGLAARVGMSQGLLSKSEAGVVELDEERWARLSEELDAPVRLLRLPIGGIVEPAVVFHRKRSSLQVSDANRLRARLDLIQLQLLGLVGDRARVELERVELDDEGWLTPQEVADTVRAALGVPAGPVENLVGALESGGVAVLRRDLGTTRMDALMSWPKGGRPVVLLGDHAPGDRQRFTVAHELGHAVMHTVPREDQEAEADRFASQFLMPQQEVSGELADITVPKLARLKARWGVSMAALLRRARDLDKISEAAYRRMNIEFSQSGFRTNEPVEVPLETPHLVNSCVHARLQAGETVSALAYDAWMTPGAFVPAYLEERMVNDDDRAHA